MLDPHTITGGSGAFIAGMVTSLHCVGMCGPLACAFSPVSGDRAGPHTVTTVYHLTRIFAYTILGGMAGFVGRGPLEYFHASPARFLPWALVLFFLIIALGLDRLMPKPKWVTKKLFQLTGRMSRWPKTQTAVVLGAITPFLPCGPLYLVFGLALVTGSPYRGAEFLLAFGLGTLPLLWIVHSQYLRFRERFSPLWISRVQRIMAVLATLVIAWRLRGSLGFGASCPFCH